jgi:tRNA pseudouridine38-40 synthase
MGSSWSKEKTVENPQVETRPATIEKSGSKRSFNSDEVESNPSKKKRGQFKKKNSWAKKEGKDKKMKNETGGLQTRPESLGPREPRIPKKKVALMVGFNGTGYQGMQL